MNVKKIDKFRIFIIIAVIITCILPYFIAYIKTPADSVFTGFVYETIDNNTYISKMSNAEKGWHFINNYTTGNDYGGYHFIFYIILGKLALLFQIPYIWMFHISRTALSICLVFALYNLLDNLELKGHQKNIIAFFVLFGGNQQWLLELADVLTYGHVVNNGLMIVESMPSYSMLYIPHFIFVMIFQVLIAKHIYIYEENRLRNSLWISLFLSLICFVHPFIAVFNGIIFGLVIFINDIKNKQVNLKNILYISLFAVFSLPYLIYSLYAFTHFDMLIKWQLQGESKFSSVSQFIIVGGLSMLAGVFVVITKWAWEGKRKIFSSWFASMLFLSMFPFNFQRRLWEGLFIPAFILIGWFLSEKFKNRYITVVVALFFAANTFWMAIQPLFMPKDYVMSYINYDFKECLDWINKNVGDDERILANNIEANFIPAYSFKKVISGHHDESFNYQYWVDVWKTISETGDYEDVNKIEAEYYLANSSSNELNPEKFELVYENGNFLLYRIKK